MPQAYRIHSQVSADGTLKLENLPFQPGEEVEVIVLAEERRVREERRYPLRGKPLVYDDPTAPVADSEAFLARVRRLQERTRLPALTDELLEQARREGRP